MKFGCDCKGYGRYLNINHCYYCEFETECIEETDINKKEELKTNNNFR